MKKSCAWQTHCFIREKENHIVLVDVKQKLIFCLWGKIQKVCTRKGCESDSMRTSARTGDDKSD